MTINTLPARFDGQNLDIIIIGNERWLGGAQVGHSLGYMMAGHAIGKLYKRNAREFGPEDTMVVELPTNGGPQLTRLYSAKGVAKIAMFANTPKAAAFRDWAARQLTSPEPAPAPTIGATAMTELRNAWLGMGKHRQFLRYARLGLSAREIGLLLGWKTSSHITKKRRAAEALGLLEPPANLTQVQQTARLRPPVRHAQGGASHGA